ncbi:MAG: class I SAM-dependent methyltransferase [Alphaproteobacteria bacterium]
MIARLRYLVWAAGRQLVGVGRACPSCGDRKSARIDGKFLVTSLRRCAGCGLMFRTPTDSARDLARFYQSEYSEGFTTDFPDDAALAALIARRFRGTDRDYGRTINILRALGVAPGARLFDFGCSWGYGSWQMRDAGFEVEAYELSAPRRAFAADKLGIAVHESTASIDGPFDVFFSSHVLEHVPEHGPVFDLAHRLLRPGGLFVALTPNGADAFRRKWPRRWHTHWSKVHPLLLDNVYYDRRLANAPRLFASSDHGVGGARAVDYDYDAIGRAKLVAGARIVLDLSGGELLCVARKPKNEIGW